MRRPVTGLLRCKGAVASFTTPKFSLARSPEVADGCGYSDHVLAQARLAGLLRCMSTRAGSGQQRLDRVLASSGLVLTLQFVLSHVTHWSKLQACCRLRLGSTGGHERSGLGGVFLSRCLSWAPFGMGGSLGQFED